MTNYALLKYNSIIKDAQWASGNPVQSNPKYLSIWPVRLIWKIQEGVKIVEIQFRGNWRTYHSQSTFNSSFIFRFRVCNPTLYMKLKLKVSLSFFVKGVWQSATISSKLYLVYFLAKCNLWSNRAGTCQRHRTLVMSLPLNEMERDNQIKPVAQVGQRPSLQGRPTCGRQRVFVYC